MRDELVEFLNFRRQGCHAHADVPGVPCRYVVAQPAKTCHIASLSFLPQQKFSLCSRPHSLATSALMRDQTLIMLHMSAMGLHPPVCLSMKMMQIYPIIGLSLRAFFEGMHENDEPSSGFGKEPDDGSGAQTVSAQSHPTQSGYAARTLSSCSSAKSLMLLLQFLRMAPPLDMDSLLV